MKTDRRFIKVTGIVQGVGFRPFIYRIALEENLKGWVNNTSEGVLIDVEGTTEHLRTFQKRIQEQAPPFSQIEEVLSEPRPYLGYSAFRIEKSDRNEEAMTLISPDLAICPECEKEINDPHNTRCQYPFTNCTNCGPRFSIIKELPYDREMTTMGAFQMCEKCQAEYEDPLNRRFHAQPNACPKCGPRVWLTDSAGHRLDVQDPIKEVCIKLKEGAVIGFKGLGGFQLLCDATNPEAIKKLRERKKRTHKAFAVMMKDIKTVTNYCLVSDKEKEVLTGIQKPILLLDKKHTDLPEDIAPGQKRLGVMLPYTPLHHLVFQDTLDVLVVTSGNTSRLPMAYKNEEAIKQLAPIVDCFLLHDREIWLPVDDSVSRVILGKERLIRRARGYAPFTMKCEGIQDTLACGSHLKNTFSISMKERIFVGQHIGDLENLETYQYFESCVSHFKHLYQIKPGLIAYDLHPEYLSSMYAEKEEGRKIAIQHHHAHIASCMAEHGLNETVLGIAYDGTGYGTDGKIWGGEFFICNYEDFQRVGQLNDMLMPGGDAAIKEPWRMAVSQLYACSGENLRLPHTLGLTKAQRQGTIQMLKLQLNCPKTSSMGRLFDSVAGLLGLCNTISYEAEGAIALENISDLSDVGPYPYSIERLDSRYVINTQNVIQGILTDLEADTPISKIAGRFHTTVIHFTAQLACKIYDTYKISKVVLSGGVFQNEILLKAVYEVLTREGFEVYMHEKIPCNDGGISLGQLVIANHKNNKGDKTLCV